MKIETNFPLPTEFPLEEVKIAESFVIAFDDAIRLRNRLTFLKKKNGISAIKDQIRL